MAPVSHVDGKILPAAVILVDFRFIVQSLVRQRSAVSQGSDMDGINFLHFCLGIRFLVFPVFHAFPVFPVKRTGVKITQHQIGFRLFCCLKAKRCLRSGLRHTKARGRDFLPIVCNRRRRAFQSIRDSVIGFCGRIRNAVSGFYSVRALFL